MIHYKTSQEVKLNKRKVADIQQEPMALSSEKHVKEGVKTSYSKIRLRGKFISKITMLFHLQSDITVFLLHYVSLTNESVVHGFPSDYGIEKDAI